VNYRGTILVLLLLAAGLVAAGTAIWHQYRQTRLALDFWGPEAAHLIGDAPSVKLTALQPRRGAQKTAAKGAQAGPIVLDISRTRGLVHFRRSLLEDANFEWNSDLSALAAAEADYSVRFSDGKDELEILVDLNARLVRVPASGGGVAKVTERMSDGLATFFEETLAEATE
jgi:hypothetical protein